jgi:hypothetical protein
MRFARAFEYDRDAQALVPLVFHSRIERGAGDPVPLVRADAGQEPGCAWPPGLAGVTARLVDGNRAAEIRVALKRPMLVSEFLDLVVAKRSLLVRVTLHPSTAAAPGTADGPFSVQSDIVEISLPDIPPGKVHVEPAYIGEDGAGNARAKVRATVEPTRLLDPGVTGTDAWQAVTASIAIEPLERNAPVVPDGPAIPDGPLWVSRVFSAPLSPKIMKNATVGIRVTARAFGKDLVATTTLTFDMQRKYVLQLSTRSLDLSARDSGSFTAAVYDETDGALVPVPDATVGVSVPGEAQAFLSAAPQSGLGSLVCHVTKTGRTAVSTVVLQVAAAVGTESVPGSPGVTVHLGGPSALEAACDPATLDPFLVPGTEGNRAVVRARLKGDDGQGVQAADISIAPGAGGDWLDLGEPSAAGQQDGWTLCPVTASSPDPESVSVMPPESGEVLVTATDRATGTVTGPVMVRFGLHQRPFIEVEHDRVTLLKGSGKSVTVPVKVIHGEPYTWTITLDPGNSPQGVTCSLAGTGGQAADLTITERSGAEEDRPGPEEVVRVTLCATPDGRSPLTDQKRDITVLLVREGLFLDVVYTWTGKDWRTDGHTMSVPLRVDLPPEDPGRVSYVKLSARVWDGEQLVEDRQMTAPGTLTFSGPSSDDPRAQTILGWNDLAVRPAREQDPHSPLEETWAFNLERFVPGNGERYPAAVEASCPAGKLEIPLEIIIAAKEAKELSTREERDHLFRLISRCIRTTHPKYTELVHDLTGFGKTGPGAKDYRGYAEVIWDTAQEIWAEDKADYLAWQPWEGKIGYVLDKTKKVGDFAFIIVIGYYTRSLGFAGSFTAQQFIPLFKDEAISFFNYYVDRYGQGEDDVEAVFLSYCSENWKRLTEQVAVAGVDSFIMLNFDPKNPNPKILVMMFAWKFAYHKARDRTPKNEPVSWTEAFLAACQDMLHLALILVFQQFVNAHGDKTMRELFRPKGTGGPEGGGGVSPDGDDGTGVRTPEEPGQPGRPERGTPPGPAAPPDPAVRAAVQTVREMQRSTPNECLVLHDAQGNEVARRGGDSDGASDTSVGYPSNIPLKGLNATHTHPTTRNGELGGAHSSGDVGDAIRLGLGSSTVAGEQVHVLRVNNQRIDAKFSAEGRSQLAAEMQTVHEGLLKTRKAEADAKIADHLEAMRTGQGREPTPAEVLRVKNDYYLDAKRKACERLAELYPQYISFGTYAS